VAVNRINLEENTTASWHCEQSAYFSSIEYVTFYQTTKNFVDTAEVDLWLFILYIFQPS
jgi:hypothetical protein